jgi:hypothetical protein
MAHQCFPDYPTPRSMHNGSVRCNTLSYDEEIHCFTFDITFQSSRNPFGSFSFTVYADINSDCFHYKSPVWTKETLTIGLGFNPAKSVEFTEWMYHCTTCAVNATQRSLQPPVIAPTSQSTVLYFMMAMSQPTVAQAVEDEEETKPPPLHKDSVSGAVSRTDSLLLLLDACYQVTPPSSSTLDPKPSVEC